MYTYPAIMLLLAVAFIIFAAAGILLAARSKYALACGSMGLAFIAMLVEMVCAFL